MSNQRSVLLRSLGLFLLLAGNFRLSGQLQFPGKPLGINRQMKATDAMYVLPPPDPLEIEAEMELNRMNQNKPIHFALERPVDLSPESHGSWSQAGDLKVWRIQLISPGARSLGLIFGRYVLLPGVKLFVYDPDQTRVKGAFTSENNKPSGVFPVGHIPGEELVIEMQVPAGMTTYGELELRSISHAFLDTGYKSSLEDCPKGEFGCSEPCHIDINCPEGEPWWNVKSSVVRIYFASYYCSGVLVNNTAYDGTPYVLTAQHCLDSQEYTEASVFQFNYESPSCFGEDGPLDMSISAGDLITVGQNVDFSLVRLSIAPPASFGAYYAGWDRSEFQTTGTATIHHPYGDVKKISIDLEPPSMPASQDDAPYPGLAEYYYNSFWWIKQWDMGSTEGGSSGAPLFNQAGRVIGTLTAGAAECGDSIGYDYETGRVIYDPAPSYDDYFAQFSKAWDYEESKGNALKPWLDPVQADSVAIGGYLPSFTSYPEKKTERHFRIYPNPATGFFRIESLEPIHGTASYMLMNLSGVVLERGIFGGDGSTEIPAAAMPPGLYIVRVQSVDYLESFKLMISVR